MSINKNSRKFFITHSFRDSDFGQRLTDDLRRQGLEGFHDFYSFRSSPNLLEQVSPGLEESDVYLPVLSNATLQSPGSKEEIDAAIALGSLPGRNGRPRIIGILLQDLGELPVEIRPMMSVNFTRNYEQALRELLAKGFGVDVVEEPAPERQVGDGHEQTLTLAPQPAVSQAAVGTKVEAPPKPVVPVQPAPPATAKAGVTYCTNHPQTETLLRCNKCGRPMCIKCVERTPVGYRCRECLGQQRQGYYNANPLDYVIAAVVGVFLSVIAGVVMSFISGVGLFGIILGIFGGPIGGGIIAEGIRIAVQRRRGRYLWLVACSALIIGGLIGLGMFRGVPFLLALLSGNFAALSALTVALLFNLGFWVYLALAVSTAYARLRV